jgi:tetratricopeptide (TPR) repeat protein
MSTPHVATDAHTRPVTLADDWAQLPASSEDWQPGQRLGPYQLQRQLGKGGMGVVWLAQQLTPLQREVAIKLLPRNPDNALSEIYFEVERQALAQLSHQAIAQIYDAGRLPDGALFFAMEYVPGEPLDVFLQQHPLPLTSIARLMVQICRGAHHAHQRALVHRDLKPLNILVQMVDGEPRPKIIDFGLAIGTLPGSPSRLELGTVVGTPGYMSPEQLTPGPEGIDARSDVYALGATLGRCLCWRAGIDVRTSEVDGAALQRELRQSLLKPASKVAETAALPSAKLRMLPRELRAIAIKALATDREQRYESAAAMADDLVNWLQRRPVRALPYSRWYATRCFMRRNRLATAAAGTIVLALLVGVLMALHGMNQAREAQALAEQRRDDAERLIQFMLGDFADKLRPINRLDLLDSVGQQALNYLTAQSGADDAPSALSRARALRTLGEVRVTRQQFELAREPLQQAAALLAPWREVGGADAAEVHFEDGTIAYWRGAIAYRLSDLDRTEVHWREYLQAARRLQAAAPDDPRSIGELAAALSNLGTLSEARDQFAQALEYFQQSVAVRQTQIRGPGDRANLDLANTLSWISRIQNNLGAPAQAWQALEQALRLVTDMRREVDDNQLRQRETNLRYLLGMNSVYRGDLVRARQEFGIALELARQDVMNDPSQPRRLAMLAKIIFEWVRASAEATADVGATLDEGVGILAAMAPDSMTGTERVGLQAKACMARLSLGPAPVTSCVDETWPALAAAASTDPTMLELAAEMAALTAQKLPGSISIAELVRIERELSALPAEMRASLGHKLILRSLHTQIDPASAHVAEITTQIDQLRASFIRKPEGD